MRFALAAAPTPIPLTCLPYDGDGICVLLQLGPHRLLFDCGLSAPQALFDAPPADWVFCAHARPERARGLLPLHEAFPELPICASQATAQLLPLNWDRPVPTCFRGVPRGTVLTCSEDLTVEFVPAGHIPGASAILATYTAPERTYRALYAGDFFLSNLRLAEGMPVETVRGLTPDVLVLDGSAGTARHPHRRKQENRFVAQVAAQLDRNVLLPLPAIGYAQEVLFLLRSHHQFTGRDLDIWTDAAIARACDAYLELLPLLPLAARNFAKHQSLFWDQRVGPRLHRLRSPRPPGSRPYLLAVDAASDWAQFCREEPQRWAVMLPEGRERPPLPAACRVETYLLAQHSDASGTTQLIHNLRPQHVVFASGPARQRADLTNLEELQSRYHLHNPAAGQLVELPVGDRFVQPAAPPEQTYPGEVSEGALGEIAVRLPAELASDPRWHNFADTGVVAARWEGEELVLRGLSPDELLQADAAMPANGFCCATCRFARGWVCRNPRSPLHGRTVPPEGYCLAYEERPASESERSS